MSFNTEMDPTKAPFTIDVMTLSNDECVEVKTKCEKIKEEFEPTQWVSSPDTQYVVGTYNKTDWTKAINGNTYDVLERYNPEVNTQGIAPDAPEGIVPEPEQPEESTEEPTETPEEPTEGETSPDEENQPNEPETAPADEATEQPTEEA